jgi:glycosyltransferase involved in cell wall biosynthesis
VSELGAQKPTPTRVAIFTAGFPPARSFGGPTRTLEALIEQQPAGFASLTLASDRDHGDKDRLPVTSNEQIDHGARSTYYISTDNPRAVMRAYRVVRQFRPEVVYLNSFFNWHFSIMPQLASAFGVFRGARLAIAPRGELSPGALAIRPRKKHIFIRLYVLVRLDRRIVWHASSKQESDEIAGVFGHNTEILIRENETQLPLYARQPTGVPDKILALVFLSRISEKKGLHTLLQSLMHTHEPVHLSVFGHEEDARYLARCEDLASRLPVNVTCEFHGPVAAELVRDTFARFDLFAFPTAGENFGHVIAESLSVSCPVMCADTTPWTRTLALHRGGVIVRSRDPREWAEAIDSFAELSSEARVQKRLNAGAAYEKWRSGDKGDHIFEQLRRTIA